MKHSIFLKAIAIVLAACALTVAVGSAFGIVVLAQAGLYTQGDEQWHDAFYREKGETLARDITESYAARVFGGFTTEELQYLGWGISWQNIGQWQGFGTAQWGYRITDSEENLLESNYDKSFEDWVSCTFTMRVEYPTRVASSGDWTERRVMYEQGEAPRSLYIAYEPSPEYTVTVWFASDSIRDYNGISVELYGILMKVRYPLIVALVVGVVLFVACLVYLFFAAGKKRAGDLPMPGGLNRLPLDIYGAMTASISLLAAGVTIEIVEDVIYYSTNVLWGWLAVAVGCVLAASVCIVGFLVALAAQWKMHGFYVWHHSFIGWCCGKLWKLLRIIWRGLCKLYDLLPLIWKYLLIGLAMGFFPMWFFYLAAVGSSFWVFFLFLSCLCDVAIIAYGAYAYGTVLQGAGKMAAGELYSKVDTKYLVGAYKTCGENLNVLADVAVVAAKKQMQSDRMKTELITNVSHDIKTPLTSIINYIDLLQKAENQEQSAEYLQVLDRQSQRLKKLIDDLLEMSKATTGDMSVNIGLVDSVEAVNQALGEFADKLTAQSLTVVFCPPGEPLPVLADGRLLWRVLSNLLSNIVKYALPGTRVYVDIASCNGQVQLHLKNISREALNVSAEELTERFVRGDASRNTEGSGLGLNIAKSLMELQKGSLELLVDGDLFKVTLTFPES